MSAAKFFLTLLFFPVLLVSVLIWLIYWKFWGKKQNIQEKKRKKQEKKLLTHIYNFSPARLKNRSWRNISKKRKKKQKKTTKTHDTK